MTKKVSNFTKNICYSLIISLCAFLIINHSVYASNWSNNHKKAVKNECKIAVKNGEYLTQKECKFHKYSIINSYGYADTARLQDPELERMVKLKCTIYMKKSVFEYNQCVETYVNKQLGIERPPDPEKPKEIINNPEEPTQIVQVPTSKTADDLYNELKQSVVFVESFKAGKDNLNDIDLFNEARIKAWEEKRLKTGSAVLIDKNIFATNCHVIVTAEYEGQELSKQEINDVIDIVDVSKKTTDENRIYFTEFLDGNLATDVCLVKVFSKDYEGTPVNIKKASEVKLFDTVYALGNPQGNAATFSRGKITGETYNLIEGFSTFYEEDALVFQHDAPIEGGNSGGGLFDDNGNLIAINSAGSIESMENKNLIPHSYAIAIDEFLKFLP
jgi:S1-C subfamily serine protease